MFPLQSALPDQLRNAEIFSFKPPQIALRKISFALKRKRYIRHKTNFLPFFRIFEEESVLMQKGECTSPLLSNLNAAAPKGGSVV